MYIIGITGGICSGKTTVTDLFSQLAVPIIDTDIIAREVVSPGTLGYNEVIRKFGAKILTHEKKIDRKLLRKLIFSDENKRETLEQILHPLISDRVSVLAQTLTDQYCIISVPLLYETGGYDIINRVLVIETPPTQQLSRLMKRDSLTYKEGQAILSAQATAKQRNSIADDIIDNSGDIKQIHSQVETLHAKYLRLADQFNVEQNGSNQ